MTRKTISVKGETVDFDLLETKQKIEQNSPRVMEVRQREDFVHSRRKSRSRRSVMERIMESKGSSIDGVNTQTEPSNLPDIKENSTANIKEKKKRTIVKKETSTN